MHSSTIRNMAEKDYLLSCSYKVSPNSAINMQKFGIFHGTLPTLFDIHFCDAVSFPPKIWKLHKYLDNSTGISYLFLL